jgi:chromosomal replication initiation ATPase DnaA
VQVGLVQLLDKIVARFALTIYPYSLAVAADLMDLEPIDIVGPSKTRPIVKARVLVCYWAAMELGMPMTSIASRLQISVSTVSVAVNKGRKMMAQEKLNLVDLMNIEI